MKRPYRIVLATLFSGATLFTSFGSTTYAADVFWPDFDRSIWTRNASGDRVDIADPSSVTEYANINNRTTINIRRTLNGGSPTNDEPSAIMGVYRQGNTSNTGGNQSVSFRMVGVRCQSDPATPTVRVAFTSNPAWTSDYGNTLKTRNSNASLGVPIQTITGTACAAGVTQYEVNIPASYGSYDSSIDHTFYPFQVFLDNIATSGDSRQAYIFRLASLDSAGHTADQFGILRRTTAPFMMTPRAGADPYYINYAIRLAPPCTASPTGIENGRFRLYDGDNFRKSGAGTAGAWDLAEKWTAANNKENYNPSWPFMPVRFILNDGTGRVEAIGRNPDNTVTVAQRGNVRGWFRDIDHTSRVYIPSNERSNERDTLLFSFSENMQYTFNIRDVNSGNFLAIRIPFDEIRGKIGADCSEGWSLSPTASVTPETVPPGASVEVTGQVSKIAATPSNAGWHEWRIARLVFAPGATPSPASLPQGNGDICSAVTNDNAALCDATFRDNDDTFPIGTDVHSDTFTDTIDSGLAVGSQVCYVTYVRDPTRSTTDDNIWRYSGYACVLVGKTPSVQVWGNDLRVGSGWTAATAKNSVVAGALVSDGPQTYGSWGEYGVLAPGSISTFGSASGLAGGATSVLQTNWSDLTFANTNSPAFGDFTPTAASMGLLPDIQSYVDRFDGDPDVNVLSAATINGWPSAGPPWINHYVRTAIPPGTITISGNIERPTDAYADAESMPQLIIIAQNININQNVERIDAWLIATESINTCADVVGNPTADTCSDQLIVNGPIIAEQLNLRRTAGSDSVANLDEPAEILNMPASTYVWARHYDEKYGRLKTVSLRELPVRY